jgi:hypothetical protein
MMLSAAMRGSMAEKVLPALALQRQLLRLAKAM